MKTLRLSLFILGFQLNLYPLIAQLPVLKDIKTFGTASSDQIKAMYVDNDGNIYVTGSCGSTLDWDQGPENCTVQGNNRFGVTGFVVKFSPKITPIWCKAFACPDGEVSPNDVAVYRNGDVLVTGSFTATADFDPGPRQAVLPANGQTDIFIVKLNSQGEYLWAKSIGGRNQDGGRSLGVDWKGNVYLTGTFTDTVDFNPGPGRYELKGQGGEDIFVCKLSADGAFVWARAFASTASDVGVSLAVDSLGYTYSTGTFWWSPDFDPGEGSQPLTSGGQQDIYILKLSPDGEWIWARSFGWLESDGGMAITATNSGSVFVTGYATGKVNFNTIQEPVVISPGGLNQPYMFIMRLNKNGNMVWTKGIAGTNGFATPNAICVDNQENVYTTGIFRGTVDFDPNDGVATLSAPHYIFISKLDSKGRYVWAVPMGGPETQMGYDISVDKNGLIHSAGVFENTADFDPGNGTSYAASRGRFDMYIHKMK